MASIIFLNAKVSSCYSTLTLTQNEPNSEIVLNNDIKEEVTYFQSTSSNPSRYDSTLLYQHKNENQLILFHITIGEEDKTIKKILQSIRLEI